MRADIFFVLSSVLLYPFLATIWLIWTVCPCFCSMGLTVYPKGPKEDTVGTRGCRRVGTMICHRGSHWPSNPIRYNECVVRTKNLISDEPGPHESHSSQRYYQLKLRMAILGNFLHKLSLCLPSDKYRCCRQETKDGDLGNDNAL